MNEEMVVPGWTVMDRRMPDGWNDGRKTVMAGSMGQYVDKHLHYD